MIKRVIAAIISAIVLFTGGGAPTYSPLDAENIKLSFVACADTHIESNNPQRFADFIAALKDMSGASRANDAMVICGDVTMNGQLIEYLCLTALLRIFGKAKSTLLVMGNHEIFTEENGYEKSFAKFNAFSRLISGNTSGEPYYYKVINGYYFIVLGSQADMGVQAYISPEQLSWLDETLAAATESGLPAFVFCHFPLEGTTVNYWQSGLIGEQSDEIYDILQKYENVFYFSGHLHNAINVSGVNTIGNVTFVDVPTLISGAVTQGFYETGLGYQVEVYEDRVELRTRVYAKDGKWLDEFSSTVLVEA